MKDEALQLLGNFLNANKILIIIIIVLMIAIFAVIKIWLHSNRMPDLFRSTFGIGRDYRSELQAIVDRDAQYTKGLCWVYGDMNLFDYEQKLAGLQMNIHKSYIVAFGGARMVIIPVLVEKDRITGYEPLVVTKDIISHLEYSNMLKITKIHMTDNLGAIEYRVLGAVYKSATFTDIFSKINEETGETVQPYDNSMSPNTIVSKVNIDQTQEQKQYALFIKEFIHEIDRK